MLHVKYDDTGGGKMCASAHNLVACLLQAVSGIMHGVITIRACSTVQCAVFKVADKKITVLCGMCLRARH